MTALSEEERSWLNHLAIRLREVQADLGSAAPASRQDLLQETLGKALGEVPGAARKHYLEYLLARFPVQGAVASSAPAPPSSPDSARAETAEELTARLLEMIAQ